MTIQIFLIRNNLLLTPDSKQCVNFSSQKK